MRELNKKDHQQPENSFTAARNESFNWAPARLLNAVNQAVHSWPSNVNFIKKQCEQKRQQKFIVVKESEATSKYITDCNKGNYWQSYHDVTLHILPETSLAGGSSMLGVLKVLSWRNLLKSWKGDLSFIVRSNFNTTDNLNGIRHRGKSRASTPSTISQQRHLVGISLSVANEDCPKHTLSRQWWDWCIVEALTGSSC